MATVVAHSIITSFPSIKICASARVVPEDENVKMWHTIQEQRISELECTCRIMVTWSTCPEFPVLYEPLCELDENGVPTKYLSGLIQNDFTYQIPTNDVELEKQIKTVSILNLNNGWIFQIPFSTMCVSSTLRNMAGDLGDMDDTPILISADVINGHLYDNLQLFRMMRIIGNPEHDYAMANWKHTIVAMIKPNIRIFKLDSGVFKTPGPNPEWIGFPELNYLITAIDYLDIHPMCMYVSHIYAQKLSESGLFSLS